ncbi:AAA family ATPase [Muricauda sp. JGD-17]|uniref:AAA family ATPase n=1 Tax=Flagellimonas ochracea TaxID=2696472 RepID=A0A964TDZ4_9FLAO|nr:AAA family ATPase [Allomuricauda ochracea]NAY91726.1 AAA family ATPase [Allomuricauda ochracea]
MKILLFGASGTGTTTLGMEIAKRTDFKHLDIDDYYWKKTDPPFQEKILLTERNANLKADFKKYGNVVVSGSLVSWGKEWESAFDMAVFMRLENTERMQRLKKREKERYGEKLLTDEKTRQISKNFLEWANQYENPKFTGRSLKVHMKWMESLGCEVLKMDGQMEIGEKTNILLQRIKAKGYDF